MLLQVFQNSNRKTQTTTSAEFIIDFSTNPTLQRHNIINRQAMNALVSVQYFAYKIIKKKKTKQKFNAKRSFKCSTVDKLPSTQRRTENKRRGYISVL